MEPHYIHEIPVTIEQVHDSEKSLDNHSKAWAEILQIGADAGPGQSDRVKRALTVNKSSVAPLRGLRKDHKLNWDRVKGPPLRPLCNARLGPNAYLGNLQARFLRTVRIGLSKLINTEVCVR